MNEKTKYQTLDDKSRKYPIVYPQKEFFDVLRLLDHQELIKSKKEDPTPTDNKIRRFKVVGA